MHSCRVIKPYTGSFKAILFYKQAIIGGFKILMVQVYTQEISLVQVSEVPMTSLKVNE